MKKRSFEVTLEQMPDFAEILSEVGLENEVAGTTEDGDIIINVYYEREESSKVLELMEWLDEEESDDDED